MLTDSACYRKPRTSSSWHKLNLQWYWSSTRSPMFHSRRDETFWRVNVLYFVGIGSQPQKTWRHRKFTAPEVVTRNHDGGNRKSLSLWQRQYGGPNNNMAAKESQRLYLFSFSHYILKDVDTSNCKAMINMIKATCFFWIISWRLERG